MKKSRAVRPRLLVVVSPYLFCPAGALPVGFVDTVGTPFAFPFGVLPPPLVWVSVILANATPPNDILSANISAVSSNAMRFLICSHLLSLLANAKTGLPLWVR
jgi:hypothetical protein